MHIFPFNDPEDANRRDWQTKIISWFKANYQSNPQKTMEILLGYIFKVLSLQMFNKYPMALGEGLLKYLSAYKKKPKAETHHLDILKLLKIGLSNNVSHFFMLPEINKRNLLDVPNYSKILLATRCMSLGEYKNASKIALAVGEDCCLARYVMGQSKRKLGFISASKEEFHRAEQLLGEFKIKKQCCSSIKGETALCNEHLLEAEVMRGYAVVLRKQKNREESIIYFEHAMDAAKNAVKKLKIPRPLGSDSKLLRVDRIDSSFDKAPLRQIADVHFGFGYFWYEQGEYQKAKELFGDSIKALDLAKERWDSPHTRQAIVDFCQEHWTQSIEHFHRALNICDETLTINREASLSRALCILGLKVLEHGFSDEKLTDFNVESELKNAILQKPTLTRGPLECHYSDAGHLKLKLTQIRVKETNEDKKQELYIATGIVQKFMRQLEKELMKIDQPIKMELPFLENRYALLLKDKPIEAGEAEEHLKGIIHAVTKLQNSSLEKKIEKLNSLLDEIEKNLTSENTVNTRLKAVIPIIPLLLSYEVDLNTDNLFPIWKKLKSKFQST